MRLPFGSPPLLFTAQDLQDPGFNHYVLEADMVISLSRHGHELEVLWGQEVPEMLVKGEIKHPKIVYLMVDFEEEGELEEVARAVRRIKQPCQKCES